MPMLVSKQQRKIKKREKLRHLEYYGLQEILDKLYAESKIGRIFKNLMAIIRSEENIKLAYRNIKKNTGSNTKGTDKLTIKEIAKIPEQKYIEVVRNKISWYKPKAVRRVEIPKPNGKTRPLGIPTIWDRLVQQCILQVLEPICEAKFSKHSHGFRPNRSAEHAIAEANFRINHSKTYFVVDVDIKGFFDNVNHTKLVQQMWNLGIRDKTLICIIKEMLKAPIVLPNGSLKYPSKGTPQGGILSPLLSNIVLNELDWWVVSQWEDFRTQMKNPPKERGDNRDRGLAYTKLRRTKLKEMYIVRYADDFKIFCRKRSDANKIFEAIKSWLKERLYLDISEEKSKVVNLKKKYSEFLGIKLKATARKKKYVVRSQMCDKAMKKATNELISQLKKIQTPMNKKEEWNEINLYNSMVIGLHNYYKMATCISIDMRKIGRRIDIVMKSRLKSRTKRIGELDRYSYIKRYYGKSKQMRFISGFPIIPVSYVKFQNHLSLNRKVNSYTKEGRIEIHKNLSVDMKTLYKLMQTRDAYRSIEYMDNRISLYSAQNGKCGVTGKVLEFDEIHCHHKKPKLAGGTDEYKNLIILNKDVHLLVHAVKEPTIKKYIDKIKPDKKQLEKINKLRKLVNNELI